MRQRERTWKRALAAAALATSVVATSCGGGESTADPAVTAEAANNEASLQLDGDLAATQLLDAATGQVTSVGEVVTGDRAVLLWYWAPH